MTERKAQIRKVTKTEEGGANVVAHDPRISNNQVVGGNIIAAESPAFVENLKKLAQKNGTSIEVERQKFYDDIINW